MSKDELMLDDLKDLLLGEELRRKNVPSRSSSSALVVDSGKIRERAQSKGNRFIDHLKDLNPDLKIE